MLDTPPTYEVFAIRYATRDARRGEHFTFGAEPHDAPMPMDYFIWVALAAGRAIVFDCGFTAETSQKRGRSFLRCPIGALALLGIDGGQVEDVVISHLHYDHVGNFHKLPNARFHIQEPEIQFAVGRHMRHRFLSFPYELDDILGIVRLNYGGRIRFYNGLADIAPGISAHLVGGHTPGLQFLRIHTRRGWVVLASDVAHFYDNMNLSHPFPAAFNVPDMLEGFGKLESAASSREHIIPGHDPDVMRRYPPPAPELAGIVVRLDVAPSTSRS